MALGGGTKQLKRSPVQTRSLYLECSFPGQDIAGNDIFERISRNVRNARSTLLKLFDTWDSHL